MNKFDRNIIGKGSVRAGKGFTLFLSNKDINNITKFMKSSEELGVLIDGATETVNYRIRKQKSGFLGVLGAPLTTLLVQTNIFLIVKGLSGKGVRRADKRYKDQKFLIPVHALNNMAVSNYFNYKSIFEGVLLRNNLPRIKGEVYLINVDDKNSKGTLSILL